MKPPLCIIPTFIHTPERHIPLLQKCLSTLRETTAPLDILMVDDCSPSPVAPKVLAELAGLYGALVHFKKENTGFSKTVNVGLMEAHDEGRVAVLVNMDMEFTKPDWLQVALDDPGDLIGAKLLYPTKFIQHGGVYYSLLHRYLDHKFRLAPHNMPEANVRCECPVTGALQIIKPQVMDAIGYYDENFKMAYEDVDYCLRAMLPVEHGGAGMSVVYNPLVEAVHHESMIRGGQEKYSRWHDESWIYFQTKYANSPMGMFIPDIDIVRNQDGTPASQFGHPAATADFERQLKGLKEQNRVVTV